MQRTENRSLLVSDWRLYGAMNDVMVSTGPTKFGSLRARITDNARRFRLRLFMYSTSEQGQSNGDFAEDASNSIFPNYAGTYGKRTVPYQSALTDAVGSVR